MPSVAGRHGDHHLAFPFTFRPALGIWKRLFLDSEPVLDVPAGDALLQRGRYLVEGPGHCGECHTPRTFAQAMDTAPLAARRAKPGRRGQGAGPG